jgi:hypothetical protein
MTDYNYISFNNNLKYYWPQFSNQRTDWQAVWKNMIQHFVDYRKHTSLAKTKTGLK